MAKANKKIFHFSEKDLTFLSKQMNKGLAYLGISQSKRKHLDAEVQQIKLALQACILSLIHISEPTRPY